MYFKKFENSDMKKFLLEKADFRYHVNHKNDTSRIYQLYKIVPT